MLAHDSRFFAGLRVVEARHFAAAFLESVRIGIWIRHRQAGPAVDHVIAVGEYQPQLATMPPRDVGLRDIALLIAICKSVIGCLDGVAGTGFFKLAQFLNEIGLVAHYGTVVHAFWQGETRCRVNRGFHLFVFFL